MRTGSLHVHALPVGILLAAAGCTTAPPRGAPAVPPVAAAIPHQLPSSWIYQGPSGMKGWVADDSETKSWRYSDGALRTRSSKWIGRDVQLPDRSSIEFTLSNPEPVSAFFVSLYTHVPLKVSYSPEYHVANYYTLCVFPENLLFHRLDAKGYEQYLGKGPNPHAGRDMPMRVKILADKLSKRFEVFIDGTRVADWSDPEPFAGEGTGIAFQSFAQEAELSVSDIKISAWRKDR